MSDETKLPTQIRITDQSVIRKVIEEQAREGDRTATRTAGKMIDRYFLQRQPHTVTDTRAA